MTKRYKILQKKLRELESELHHVFTLSPETPCHQLLYDSIEQRFIFMRTLLTAEIASSPSKPHHLAHIDDRLTKLETAFWGWAAHRTSEIYNFDAVSRCSCTESCLNDDGDVSPVSGSVVVYEDSEVFPVAEMEEEKAAEEKVAVAVAVAAVAERRVKREDKRVWVCSGMVVGAVLMGFVMIGFCGSFGDFEHGCFLTPT